MTSLWCTTGHGLSKILPYFLIFISEMLKTHVCMKFLAWNCLQDVSLIVRASLLIFYDYFLTTKRKVTSEWQIFFPTLIFVKQFKQLLNGKAQFSFSSILPLFGPHAILAMLRQGWNNTTGCVLWYTIPIFKSHSFGDRIFLNGKLYSPSHSQKYL